MYFLRYKLHTSNKCIDERIWPNQYINVRICASESCLYIEVFPNRDNSNLSSALARRFHCQNVFLFILDDIHTICKILFDILFFNARYFIKDFFDTDDSKR